MMDAMEKALNSSRLRTEPSFILLYWKVVKHRLYEICSFSESNDCEIRIIRALKFYLDGAFFTHLSSHSKNVRCHSVASIPSGFHPDKSATLQEHHASRQHQKQPLPD